MVVQLDLFQTAAIAVAVYGVGAFLLKRLPFLNRFCVPAPVIGGLLFSLITLWLNLSNIMTIETDMTLQTVFMMIFFSSVGYSASFRKIKKGGLQVFIFTGLAALIIVMQNLTGIALSALLGIDMVYGVFLGSIPLIGGHGTASSFGPMVEAQTGLTGLTTASAAAATFGLVMGSLIGGPAAKLRIAKLGLVAAKPESVESPSSSAHASHDHAVFGKEGHIAFSLLFFASGLGVTISMLLEKIGITIPHHVGAMIAAALIRNIFDVSDTEIVTDHLFGTFGSMALSLFLSMALMDLRLWELADMALPLLLILVAQTLLVFLFTYYAVFRIMGRDYEAAVMTSATCGFAMGATPNAIANMQVLTEKYGPAPKAFFIVPLVGSLFVDFLNSIVVTTFLSILT